MYRLPLPVVGSGPSTSRATLYMRYPAWHICSSPLLSSHVGFALCTFCSVAVTLEILKRALQVVSRLNLPAPLLTHKSVVGRRFACRVGASAPVTRFRGKPSRSHTVGRGTVLEKDSGKYRSITIDFHVGCIQIVSQTWDGSSCFRINPPTWNTILFWLLCDPILI